MRSSVLLASSSLPLKYANDVHSRSVRPVQPLSVSLAPKATSSSITHALRSVLLAGSGRRANASPVLSGV